MLVSDPPSLLLLTLGVPGGVDPPELGGLRLRSLPDFIIKGLPPPATPLALPDEIGGVALLDCVPPPLPLVDVLLADTLRTDDCGVSAGGSSR